MTELEIIDSMIALYGKDKKLGEIKKDLLAKQAKCLSDVEILLTVHRETEHNHINHTSMNSNLKRFIEHTEILGIKVCKGDRSVPEFIAKYFVSLLCGSEIGVNCNNCYTIDLSKSYNRDTVAKFIMDECTISSQDIEKFMDACEFDTIYDETKDDFICYIKGINSKKLFKDLVIK